MTSIESNSAQAPLEDYHGVSPRVNGALLPQFLGFFVILPCQLVRDDSSSLSVMAPDNVLVTVSMLAIDRLSVTPITPFLEVLGKVCEENGTMHLLATRIHRVTGPFDLSLVNRVIKHIHGPHKNRVFNVDGQQYARDLKDCEEAALEDEFI
ncbi:hypothetical protein BDP27DRAFT_1429640 [Rhodocollybia butyracea]|uniref:Uncharacterized protein n=1 Tax=Rhodocollybia butyracea TaxID=206335 RepID=A0A9P5TZH0_9AGAR|nr:hypothetical protein BDP27DRAFT_1429640 [Rhodocollybia butyracea]